jgi:hypothetical protein
MRVLPKIAELSVKTGWKTQEQTRNDVPDQKASTEVPPRSSAMVYRG